MCEQVSALSSLVALDLSCCSIEAAEWEWRPLAHLHRLTWLSLAGCAVAALPDSVWRLPALQARRAER